MKCRSKNRKQEELKEYSIEDNKKHTLYDNILDRDVKILFS